MIKIDDIKQLGLNITWRLLYLCHIKGEMNNEEIIGYAIKKLEQGNNNDKILELASLSADDNEDVCNLLLQLIKEEDTDQTFESRKLRALIVNKTLKTKNKNYIDGLADLTDLWIGLEYPDDSPHIIQGRNNEIRPTEYYTKDNYDFLYEKNVNWLHNELLDLKKRS